MMCIDEVRECVEGGKEYLGSKGIKLSVLPNCLKRTSHKGAEGGGQGEKGSLVLWG